ncbi:hypothetical protein MLD38_039442 [Melastoma candidum]|uniref:Uncharacterized protein n=1 Tax=Melastoma candidum TaxID=119954 RepID=A0ACB9L4E8_9MYRT|nr:hypothetical protein MLD38_039442 [Melastoma candidum]
MATVADAKPTVEPGGAPPAQAVEESLSGAGTEDATKESSTPSFFRNTEPMREEQVQNAVKFLSHPKVRGSPVIYRRSFLERKGLTKEEIDEAFRRVPDPAPSAAAPATSTEAQIKSTPANPAPSTQALPLASAASGGVLSPVTVISRPKFLWTHAVFAIGALALSGAGTAVLFKNTFIPRLKSWIRKIVSEDNANKTSSRPSPAEEATAAAKAAATAAAEVARASQEMLAFKLEEKKYFSDLINLLDIQLKEIKSTNNAIRKKEGLANPSNAISAFHQEDYRDWMANSRPNSNGKADHISGSVRPTLPPMLRQHSGQPHPESYMEDVNDSPPDPNHPMSSYRVAPRAKPWEVGQSQNSTGFAHQSLPNVGGSNYYRVENGVSSRTNGGNSGSWWGKKNVRIAELDQDDEMKTGTYGTQFSGGQPVRSTWVPPQPPPIAMPEAVEAIRRPKSTAQKELTDDQLMPRSSEVSEELQQVMKFSEVGGPVDPDSLATQTNISSEFLEEQEHS